MKITKRLILISAGLFLLLFLLVVPYTFFYIYQHVKTTCLAAQSEYKQDCVTSLIQLIQSENHSFRSRNTAVWALGQLTDKKALPFLCQLNQSLPAQKKCDYDSNLCQYEVQKAIKWCEHGNLTSWMYRNQQ